MQKMAARTVIGLLTILFIVASCASNGLNDPERVYPGPPLLYEKTAVLVGVLVKFVSVDGQKVKKNKSFVQVLPGVHTVTCVYDLRAASNRVWSTEQITISLETKAQHQYLFEGEISEREGKWRLNPIKELPSIGFDKFMKDRKI